MNESSGSRRRTRPTVNLALQGGGSHGAFTWGVLDRLLEDGRLDFEGVSGASAGAMNAVVLAQGWMEGGRDGAREALDRFWRTVGGGSGIFGTEMLGAWADLLVRTFSPYHLNPANLNPLRGILDTQVDFERLRADSPFRLFVSATNVRTSHVRVFDTNELTVDVLLASSCLPTVFHTVTIDGEAFWDGGYLADPPLFPFFYECESRDLLVVMVNPLARDRVPRNPGEILDRLNEITFNASLISEMRAIAFVQKLLGEGWLKPEFEPRLKNMLVHAVRADGVLSGLGSESKFTTATPFLLDLRERGRETASAWIEASLRHVGKRSSIDVRSTFLEPS
ncbi:patatin-like phospholipase family protein [Burkholderiaceae bacterium FT117]|uniref:patatin-like phospholipase family protein n=1 Tax=Zeimonas sediminis TaxID=2944268 RepID=UPI002343195C|nr:patatin-like phospholipase family protein [Zeimonas sediminis]MCM5569718.1 patatin-like phospholipase family protein [Zeimonas sediminis]